MDPNTILADLAMSVVAVIWGFASIFFIGDQGEEVTHHFDVFDEELCRCDWLSYPIDMKRLFVIFLTGTQQLAVIRGYANTVCSRVTFKKVYIFF